MLGKKILTGLKVSSSSCVFTSYVVSGQIWMLMRYFTFYALTCVSTKNVALSYDAYNRLRFKIFKN